MGERESVRVGVIGTGFGVHHIEVLQQVDGAEMTAVCSAQEQRAYEVAERFDIPFATTRYHDVFDHADAVIIVTPPRLHAPMAVDAIGRGVHVFCEKPIAATLAQARMMHDAATSHPDVVCMMNFQQRFTAHFSHAHRMVHEGQIGKLVMADMKVTMNPVDYLRSPLWSDSKVGWFSRASEGGGLLGSSVGPHLVDLLGWMGGPVAELSCRTITSQPTIELAEGVSAADIDAEDGFLLLARYESGALLTIRGIPVTYGGNEWHLELHGDAGSVVVAGSDVRHAALGADAPTPVEQPEPVNPRTAIAQTFIDAVRSGCPSPSPTFDDGLAAQAILEAAILSAANGEWVRVSAYGEVPE